MIPLLEDARLGCRWLWRKFTSLFKKPAEIRKSKSFSRAWIESRSVGDIMLGIPAIVTLTLLAVLIVLTGIRDKDAAGNLLRLATAVQQQSVGVVANPYHEQAELLPATTWEARYEQALQLQARGRNEDAVDLMMGLASEDFPEHEPVHRWLAKEFGRQLTENLAIENPSAKVLYEREELIEQVETYGARVLAVDPENIEMHHLLARVQRAAGNRSAALEHLAHVILAREELRSLYAQLLSADGRNEEAMQQARLAADYHTRALAGEFTDGGSADFHREQLARSLILLGDLKGAATTLMVDGKVPPVPALRHTFTEVLVRWSNQETGETDKSVQTKLALLQEAHRYSPRDESVMLSIAALCRTDNSVPELDQALRRLITAGSGSWLMQLVLGLRATDRGDHGLAESMFAAATKQQPALPSIMGELADAISRSNSDDHDRAHLWINTAMGLAPDRAELRETRGRILTRMGRFKQAMHDFEYALQHLSARPSLHHSMADAFAVQGKSELAELHRQLAIEAQRVAEQASSADRKEPEGKEGADPRDADAIKPAASNGP